jgi:hypothetical protein
VPGRLQLVQHILADDVVGEEADGLVRAELAGRVVVQGLGHGHDVVVEDGVVSAGRMQGKQRKGR